MKKDRQTTVEESVGPHIMDYSTFVPSGSPVRHRRKVPFRPYPMLPEEYRGIVDEIKSLDWDLGQCILTADDYMELVIDAYASNVHWSTRIEGNPLSPEEVCKITRRFSSGAVMESNPGYVQEIVNHLYPMFVDVRRYRRFSLDEVTAVHLRLMTGTGYHGVPGDIRTGEVSVQSPDGQDLFICCSPQHVREETESLLEWVNAAPFDPVCTAALFFHEFESIHPFFDGNGRVGRVLFQTMLQSMGLRHCGLCRFEKHLLEDAGLYYDLLAYTDETADYAPFVCYVAESLLNAYREAFGIYSERDRVADMDEAVRSLAYAAKDVGAFTLADASAWVPSLSDQTLRMKLNSLADMGILRKEGRSKGMRYVFNDPFSELRAKVAEEFPDLL